MVVVVGKKKGYRNPFQYFIFGSIQSVDRLKTWQDTSESETLRTPQFVEKKGSEREEMLMLFLGLEDVQSCNLSNK